MTPSLRSRGRHELRSRLRAHHLLQESGMDVDYHESENGHWIEHAHAADAKAWLAETLALARSRSGG
jgi:predicted esterase